MMSFPVFLLLLAEGWFCSGFQERAFKFIWNRVNNIFSYVSVCVSLNGSKTVLDRDTRARTGYKLSIKWFQSRSILLLKCSIYLSWFQIIVIDTAPFAIIIVKNDCHCCRHDRPSPILIVLRPIVITVDSGCINDISRFVSCLIVCGIF